MIDDLLKVFNKSDSDDGAGHVMGTVGVWCLHTFKITFLAYSAAHAIGASWNYAGSSVPQRIAQTVGVITVEGVLLGIYLAYINGRISGYAQLVSAATTYAIGFVFACMGIIVDSQLNGGTLDSSFTVGYLHYGLPIAPAIMAFGAIIVSILDPKKLQIANKARKSGELEQKKFDAGIKVAELNMQNELAQIALQVQSKQALITGMASVAQTPEYRQAVARQAFTQAINQFGTLGIQLQPTTDTQHEIAPTLKNELDHSNVEESVVSDERFQPTEPYRNGSINTNGVSH
jgi:hypothetical protein